MEKKYNNVGKQLINNIVFGIDNDGKEVSIDFTKTPKLLITGNTGSGKTRLVKNLITRCIKAGASVVVLTPETREFKCVKNNVIVDRRVDVQKYKKLPKPLVIFVDNYPKLTTFTFDDVIDERNFLFYEKDVYFVFAAQKIGKGDLLHDLYYLGNKTRIILGKPAYSDLVSVTQNPEKAPRPSGEKGSGIYSPEPNVVKAISVFNDEN